MGKADKISVVKKARHAPLAEQIETDEVVTATGRVKNRRKRDPDQANEVSGENDQQLREVSTSQ